MSDTSIEENSQTIVLTCKWCRADLEPSDTATYGVIGTDGSLDCEERVPGCTACEDGEAHPHEAASNHGE